MTEIAKNAAPRSASPRPLQCRTGRQTGRRRPRTLGRVFLAALAALAVAGCTAATPTAEPPLFAIPDSPTWEVTDRRRRRIIGILAHEFQHMIHCYQKRVVRDVSSSRLGKRVEGLQGVQVESNLGREQVLLDEIRRRGSLSTAECAQITDATPAAARATLHKLVQAGLVRAEGNTRARRYYLR